MQNWYAKNLPTAKKVLFRYKNLNRLFNNFKNYEKKKYQLNYNIILGTALPDLTGKSMPNHKQILEDYDYLVGIFNIIDATGEEYDNLRSQLTSDDYQKSAFAFGELSVANLLAVRNGFENIKLFPRLSQGIGDVSLKLDNKEIFFEVTNRGLGEPEKIIFKILEKVAEHIGKKIDLHNYFLHLSIDSKYLQRTNDGRIDFSASVEYLCQKADILEIHKLAGYHGKFFLSIAWLSAFFDYAVRKNNPQYEGFKEITQSIPKKWLLEKKQKSVKNNPFEIFHGGPYDILNVMIDTAGDMSFSKNEYVMNGFVEHLKRKIKNKINNGQFEPNHPNILVIAGTNSKWNIHGRTEGLADFIIVRQKISRFLRENDFKNLSGIIWFNSNLENAKLILNPNSDENSKLSDKMLEKMGFSIHDDKEHFGMMLHPDTVYESN